MLGSKDWGQPGSGDTMEAALKGLSTDTPLVVTFANKDYHEFLINWIVHARMSGIEHSAAIVIGAMVGPGRHTSSRHPNSFEPSFIE
jgi:hypothetical protein